MQPLFETALVAAVAIAFPALLALSRSAGDMLPPAGTVEIAAVALDYPLPGEFLVDGRPAAAPATTVKVGRFTVMAQQVAAADYSRCVASGACQPADGPKAADADVPVTGVSYRDAVAFAEWYSTATGYAWRLPTAEETAAAAAERFAGDTFAAAADSANPAAAWLRRYREQAAEKRPADPRVKARGFYGANTLGVHDFGGNVWEWTATCYTRTSLATDGVTPVASTDNCGVHVLEGKHRAYMSNFIRDGKSGGCAVGTPPEHLGFRLVRDESLIAHARLFAARLWHLARQS